MSKVPVFLCVLLVRGSCAIAVGPTEKDSEVKEGITRSGRADGSYVDMRSPTLARRKLFVFPLDDVWEVGKNPVWGERGDWLLKRQVGS